MLIALLGQGSHLLRATVVEALGQIGAPARPLLEEAARHTAAPVRAAALLALGQIGSPADWPLLETALDDDEPDVQYAACRALGSFGDARGIPALIERLGHPLPYMRGAACRSLELLGEGRLARAVHGSLLGQAGATDVLSQLVWEGDLRGLAPLLKRLSEEEVHTDVHSAACLALGAVGDARVVDPLLALLQAPSFATRKAACLALGKIGDPRAGAALRDRLADPHWLVREAACQALGPWAEVEVATALTETLQDGEWRVRRAACVALGQYPAADVPPALIYCLSDPDVSVRHAASAALGALGEAPLAATIEGLWEGDPQALHALEQQVRAHDLRALDPLIVDLRATLPEHLHLGAAQTLAHIYRDLAPRRHEICCDACLTRFRRRLLWLGTLPLVPVLVCRQCGRAGQARFDVRALVGVFDEGLPGRAEAGRTLRIDLRQHDALFDFDRLEIHRATDHEVLRLCTRAAEGAFRRRRYRRVRCLVSDRANLSENTLRVLERTFGTVVRDLHLPRR